MLLRDRIAFVRGKEVRIALVGWNVVPANRGGKGWGVKEAVGVGKTVRKPTAVGSTPARDSPSLERVDIGLRSGQEILSELRVVVLTNENSGSVIIDDLLARERRCFRSCCRALARWGADRLAAQEGIDDDHRAPQYGPTKSG